MFHSARVKLTAWYLLIIMSVSVVFSLAIFNVLNSELTRFANVQRARIQRDLQERAALPPGIIVPLVMRPVVDPELLDDARNRLAYILIATNIGIFLSSGLIGYFLAGKTLQPIQQMVDDQNRFITDASHEFRTPLTALKSSIEVSLRDKNLKIDEAKALLKSNLEDVNLLQSLSDALLELAQYQKSNTASGSRLFEKVFATKILEEAVKKVEPIAKKKKISIVKSIDANVDLQDLNGDAKGLSEVLVILLDNAIKYSPEKSTVRVSAESNDNTLTVLVKDEGMGISQEDLPHIFDRFYRADQSRSKKNVSGYGLGLSIAKKITEAHHGSLAVLETSTGKTKKGSTFVVKLPLK